jgi:hypothetical protein
MVISALTAGMRLLLLTFILDAALALILAVPHDALDQR